MSEKYITPRLPSLEHSWRSEMQLMISQVRRGKRVAKENGFDLSTELRQLIDAAGEASDD